MTPDRPKALQDVYGETALEAAKRRAREGDAHITRQRALIASLQAGGHSVEQANRLLDVLLSVQVSHEQRLAWLQRAHRRSAS